MKAALWLLVPGPWHIARRRTGKGLGLFAAFTLGVNAYLIWPPAFGQAAPALRLLFAAVACAAWLFSALDVLRKRPVPPPDAPSGPGGL